VAIISNGSISTTAAITPAPPEIVVYPGYDSSIEFVDGSDELVFGDVPTGYTLDRWVVVKNIGERNLVLGEATLLGENADNFSIRADTNPDGVVLVKNQAHAILVSCSTDSIGDLSAALKITSNDGDEASFIVPFSAKGLTPVPEIKILAGGSQNEEAESGSSEYTFGTVLYNGPVQRTFRILNVGTGPLVLGDSALTGTNADDFLLNPTTPTNGVEVLPGALYDVIIRCAPDTEGELQATLSIPSNDSDENPFVIGLSAIGEVPVAKIQVSTAEQGTLTSDSTVISYGNALIDQRITIEYTIENLGTGILNLGDNQVVGPNPAHFFVGAGTPTSGLTIAPGASAIIKIHFKPQETGNLEAKVGITNSDSGANPYIIHVSGFGVAPGDADGDGLDNIDELEVHGTDQFLADTDGDGANDGGEIAMAALGFTNGTDDSALVNLIQGNANSLELYQEDDVQSLAVGTPVIGRDPTTGSFHLTVGVQKAPDLTNWDPLINYTATMDLETGELQLEIPPGLAAPHFFRVYTGSLPTAP